MAIIPMSQLALMRLRRELQQRLDNEDWSSIAALERDLNEHIRIATNDPARAPKALLGELRKVMGLYRQLTHLCYFHGREHYHPQG